MLGNGTDIDKEYISIGDENCLGYYDGNPTFRVLVSNRPPEYLPLLVIACLTMVINVALNYKVITRQLPFLKGRTFLHSFRSICLIAVCGMFALTSLMGMFSFRAYKFLHFIVVMYESCCIIFFFENMISHLHVHNFFDGDPNNPDQEPHTLNLRVGPCCCWPCFRPCVSPTAKATRGSVWRLRKIVIGVVISQIILESGRVIGTMECQFDDTKLRVTIIDAGLLIAFLFAMWCLIIIYKSGYSVLPRYRYTAKFICFKAVIFISKILSTVLTKFVSGSIPDHTVTDAAGDTFLVMKAKYRIKFWVNFVTVLVSTALLIPILRIYRDKDHKIFLGPAIPLGITAPSKELLPGLEEGIIDSRDIAPTINNKEFMDTTTSEEGSRV